MKLKISKSNISFTNGTLVLTVTLPFALTLQYEDILYLKNATQGLTYYKYGQATGNIASITAVGSINTITLTGVANLATGDKINLLLEIDDTTVNLTTGVISTAETSPLNDKQDSPIISSSVTITTSFASLIGSELNVEKVSHVTICLDITYGTATDIWFKFIRKHTTGGNSYEIAKVTAPGGMFTATADTDGITQYELNTLATRKIAIDLELNNAIPIIDVLWKGAGTTTGTSVIATIIKTWN